MERAGISHAMRHYYAKRKDTAQELASNRASGERTNNDPVLRQAAAARAAVCDREKNRKPRSIMKYSKSTEAKYPSELIDLMKVGLVLFLQQCGRKAMDARMIYQPLRAILIEYQSRYPSSEVIEYYMEETARGKVKKRPIFFMLEFKSIVELFALTCDKNGKVGRGRFWTAKPNIVTNAQYRRAEVQRRQLLDHQFMVQVVNQSFDDWERVHRTTLGNSETGAKKLSDCANTNNKGVNENWKKYKPGTGIDLCYD